MQLWNDYEGKTIAGKYPLGPLVRPEGRSALFQLSAGVEAPAIIRLTEAINDEGQMLACRQPPVPPRSRKRTLRSTLKSSPPVATLPSW